MRDSGKRYEELACEYLKKNGYKILNSNFNTKAGEIDIVAKEKEYLVFVEVKARKNSSYQPYEAVNPAKIKKIIKASLIYIKASGVENRNIRYDVVSITGSLENPEFVLIKNAFNVKDYYL